ncbi:MAG: hypothetical protein HZB16_05590 [Armatimonadetes bacterium]|nr:hypothetical protein [Armatimonadota bacterium]
MAMEVGAALTRRTPSVKPSLGSRRNASDDRRPLYNAPMSDTVARAAALGVHDTPSIYHRDQPRIIGALLDAYS